MMFNIDLIHFRSCIRNEAVVDGGKSSERSPGLVEPNRRGLKRAEEPFELCQIVGPALTGDSQCRPYSLILR